MKKIAAFFAIVMLVGIFPCMHSLAEADGGISISCVNGEILVSGSFTADSYAGEVYNVYLATYEEDGTLLKVDKSEDLTVLSGANAVSFTAPNVRNVQDVKAFVWTKSGLNDLCASAEKTIYTLKILGIGNSFTMDAMEHLYGIADDYGIDNIVLGYAYSGGCSLETHWSYISKNSNMYTYYKNTSGSWSSKNYQRINTMLADEDWNLIVLQQVSEYSGMTETFEPYLTNIIDYVNENKPNEYAELAWQMTWAYQQNSSHSGFANYSKNQMTMYNAIVGANKYIADVDGIDFIIPSGTAIQNARTSYLGDKLTRDGYHLSYNTGRYIAAMTWFRKILGLPLDSIDWVPDSDEINSQALKVAKESAVNAVAKPDGITASIHTEKLTSDYKQYLEDYYVLEWEPLLSSFYDSSLSSAPYTSENSSSTLLPYYICTPHFTKEQIPVGSIIAVENGYQYCPEGWVSLDSAAEVRGIETTDKFVEVTSSWWGDDNYKAFNLCKAGRTEVLTGNEDLALASFHILIPKVVTEEPEYIELDYEVFPNSFYMSTVQSKPYNEITASGNASLDKFVSTKIFYKDELPNGTILEIDSGYQYRPEGWTDLTVKNGADTGTSGILRPDNVTTKRVVIDDEWWGDFNYRAFNIAYEGNATVITYPAEVASHFRILIPKNAKRLVELDYETFGGAYYNSLSATPSDLVTTMPNSKYFIATEIFEKGDIPNGSVIMIEPGFQYRPEGWTALTTTNKKRPDNVTQVITVVDDTWWGSYNYRGFNIAYSGGSTTLTDKVDYVAARFHILVPAN